MARAERAPAVAGRFYPASVEQLEREVARHLAGVPEVAPRRALAVVAPHAGYVYSGAIAGETYARVEVPQRAVVLNPNHTGRGPRGSLWSQGAWGLPGGAVEVDEALAQTIGRETDLQDDRSAHWDEHSGEVQLPFLRARRPDIKVVPICLAQLPLEACRNLGQGLARAVRAVVADPTEVLLVASTDMSHFLSAEAARRLDSMALQRLLELDPEGLYQTVTRHHISMCGFIPTTVVLFAALELGARHAELVRYGNSGEASGDYQRVVGYAGAVVE